MKTRIILTMLIVLTLLTNIMLMFVLSEKTNITIYVDDDNVDGPWDGSYEHPFKYIQDGINVSNTFDTIFIRNGTYSEYLQIIKKIYLIGEDNTNTILQSPGIEEESQFDRIITIYADNVQIKNLFIRSYNNNTVNNINAIYAENSRELIIQNNNIINCNSGILLDTNSSAEILDNHIQFYNGIPLRCIYFINPHQDSVIVISRNSIISYGDGIDFNFFKTAPSQIIIDHNHIESPFNQNSPNSFDSGIWFSHAVDTNYNLIISHNNITGFTFGIYYLGSKSPHDDSSIDIFLNSFYNENSDLYLLPNSIKSNEPFVIKNNNFYGENQQELFIEEIILDPFMIPFLINYSLGIIYKNSIQWTSNYWHYHDNLLSKQIPGKMFIYLKYPIFAIQFIIFQKDPSPSNTPFAI